MNKKKKILIAPLDWGLGHTTRCIPIIVALLERGHEVFTCGNKNTQLIFKQKFPELNHIIIDGYNVKYGHRKSQAISMMLQTPKFLRTIYKERKTAEKIANQLELDFIISDNRFGFRSSRTTNIFITHQIHIQGPSWVKPIFYKVNTNYIKRFNHCWIPDYEYNNNLSGLLSQDPKPNNCVFIGPLSRFNQPAKSHNYKYKYLAILSGPEPQRTIFEKLIIKQLIKEDEKCIIIGGKPKGNDFIKNNILYFNHLNDLKFKEAIEESKHIICRAGYSSIMDLSILQKDALLIPTPGQTEQEYLAKYHKEKSGINWQQQDKFKLNGKEEYGKISPSSENHLLEKALITIGI